MTVQLEHTGLKSIGEILTRRKKYLIPKYQREYSWTEDQVKEFTEDVKSLMREDRSLKDEYFFGAMVFVHDNDNNEMDTFKIVDGQQRITTSAIFIAVVRDILHSLDRKDDANEFNKHIKEKDMQTQNTFDRIVLSERNKDSFKDHIMNVGPPQTKSKDKAPSVANRSLYDAYTTIYNELKNNSNDQLDYTTYITKLCDRFTKLFKIICITVTTDKHAYRIFETLNNRGLELSQGDLVKNYILEQCEPEFQDEVYETWMGVINTLDKISIDDFLRHYWLATHKKIKKDQIYDVLTDINTPVKELANDLRKYAEFYEQIINPKKEDWYSNTQITTNIQNLHTLNSKICYVPILIGRDKLQEHDLARLIQMCLNFFFRYKTICRKHATRLEDLMVAIATKLRDGKDLDEIYSDFKEPKIYPSDEDFKSAFKKTDMTDKIALYVLQKLNESKITENVHLEHILPKNIIGTKWERSLEGKNKDSSLEEYAEHLYSRLGNMTLMNKLTQDERKKSYSEKSEQFYKKSPIKITNELPSNIEWDEDAIKKRQEKFSEIAVGIWKI